MNKKILSGIPIFILLITIIYLFALGIKNNIYFTLKMYLSLLLVIITFLLFIYKRDWYKHAIKIVLILGTFNLLRFTYSVDTYSFYFGENSNFNTIGIQPFSLMILIIELVLNGILLKNHIREGNGAN